MCECEPVVCGAGTSGTRDVRVWDDSMSMMMMMMSVQVICIQTTIIIIDPIFSINTVENILKIIISLTQGARPITGG